MQREFDLHELAVEDARQGHQRPKIDEYGSTLFVVMQLLELEQGEMHVGEVAVFVGPNFVLSVRNRSQQHFSACASAASASPSCWRAASGFVLVCADGRGGRPLLPAARRARDRARRRSRRRSSSAARRAGTSSACMRSSAAPPCCASGGAAARGGRQAARRPRAAVCAAMQEYFRDVARPPGAHQHRDRCHPRHHRHRHPGQPVDGDDRGVGDHQAAGGVGGDLRACPPRWPASGA